MDQKKETMKEQGLVSKHDLVNDFASLSASDEKKVSPTFFFQQEVESTDLSKPGDDREPDIGCSEGWQTVPSGKKNKARSAHRFLEPDSALLHSERNYHDDDVHGLALVTSDSQISLISGSKDNQVKKMNSDGSQEELISVSPERRTYRHWVSALDSFSDNTFLIGSRNGWLRCMNTERQQYYSGYPELPSNSQNSSVEGAKKKCYKERNGSRVTAIKCLSGYQALVGVTNSVLLYDFYTYATLGHYTFDQPEWVYGFSPISEKRFLCIHAGSLSVFDTGRMKPVCKVIQEPWVIKGAQRIFISSVNCFQGTSLYAMSCFAGITRVLDLNTEEIIHEKNEHNTSDKKAERVWQSVPVPESHSCFASCADDGLIKLWDLRCDEKSLRTIAGHPGRVSSMLFFNPNHLVAASCADNVHKDPDKAQLFFYDMRR